MAKYFTKDGDSYVEVEDALHTQTDVDSIVAKRLERDRKQFADYETLKEQAGKVNTIKTEYEDKLKEKDTKIGELSSEAQKAKLEVDKVKIIHEFKLSDELSEFVTGETPDEMRERAEKLSKGIPGGGVKVDKTGKPAEKVTESKQIVGKLFGKKSDD